MQTAYISHHDCLLHEMGPYHPESPARLRAVEDQLIASGLFPLLQHHDAPLASREQIERVHAPAYVDEIFARSPAHGMVYLDPDTAMNPHTLQAALRAAGGAVLAVDLVMAGKAKNAFCNVRPPGHHAESTRAMGFCIFNNVAVGVAHALEEHGLTRVTIADFDVHHGNGTEEIFRNDPRVMLCSTFQHPFYPHCGADTVSDHIINVPLPAGTDGAGFREAVRRRWLPELERFKPEMVFFSAGFDAHRDDEMAGLRLVEADYQWVTEQVKAIAEKYAQGRIVSVLEGGYELSALGRSAAAHIKALSGL
ncbi:MAG: histone deacetylase family protein [Pseudomonadota bacterium]